MSSYSIFARKRKKGKSIFYVQFKKSNGTYTTAKSTGRTTRRDAEAWAEDELLRNGIPVQGRDVTFEEFSKDFFSWSGRWATNKRVEGRRISERHCLARADIMRVHVLPAFGFFMLKEIDKLMIRDFRNDLYNRNYSGSMINKCLSAIRQILTAAEDQGFIRAIPKIERAADRPKKKGILTIDEVRHIFSVPWESIPSYSHPARERYISYVGNLLACVSGIRLGELQGLLLADLFLDGGYITVRRSWDRITNQLTATTKNGRERNLFIPSYVNSELRKLVERNPYKKPGSFLFFSETSETQPIDSKVFIKGLYDALKRIGIDEAERKKRNVSFHSHRHWFNSLLINAKVPLHKVQSITGHLTPEMSTLYYHPDDMSDVRQIQESLFTIPIARH